MNEMLGPWPRPLLWRDVSSEGLEIILTADQAARQDVASFLDALAVVRLEARLQVRSWLDGIQIDGRIDAAVTRLCGVTLEPFDEIVSEAVERRLLPTGSPNAPVTDAEEVEIRLDESDPPDTVDGDVVDIGALVVEQLALALDPYPRRPDASFEPPEQPDLTSPFAILATIRREDPRG